LEWTVIISTVSGAIKVVTDFLKLLDVTARISEARPASQHRNSFSQDYHKLWEAQAAAHYDLNVGVDGDSCLLANSRKGMVI
jgi:hypothetical protein